MVKHSKSPDRGDYVWLDFGPVRGREQAGRRPALVLSRRAYNARSGLALVCPITSQAKQYPFEVPVADGKIQGVILADQLTCIDWITRKPRYITKASDAVLATVIEKTKVLIS